MFSVVCIFMICIRLGRMVEDGWLIGLLIRLLLILLCLGMFLVFGRWWFICLGIMMIL